MLFVLFFCCSLATLQYVDLGKIDVVGFDFDYTLVTYKDELLELIYDMALKRLVSERQYPIELTQAGLSFDPYFSVRGLAVDLSSGWICHLSYSHKVLTCAVYSARFDSTVPRTRHAIFLEPRPCSF